MDEETYGMIESADGKIEDVDSYTAELEAEPTGPIDNDLPCWRCGYNLRGMTEDRACPECGTAVGRSLLGDQLRFSDPDWVRTLARGANWILWSVLIGIAIGIIGAVVLAIMNFNSSSVNRVDPVIALLSALPSLIYVVGVWSITSPEPGVIEQVGLPLRILIRWAAVLSCVITFLSSGARLTAPMMAGTIDMAGSIVGFVGFFALFVFARRLALRVPDYNLAKQTKIVMWGIVVSQSGMILFGILMALLGGAGAGSGVAVVAIPICMLAVAYLVFAIWSLVLLVRYRRVSNAAAQDAEQTWAKTSPA